MSTAKEQSSGQTSRRQVPQLRRFVSLSEAADYLGVSKRTVRNYIANGALKANRIQGSRLIRIELTDLDDLIRPLPIGRDVA